MQITVSSDEREIALVRVDDEGFYVETLIFYLYDENGQRVEEIPPNLVPPNTESLLEARWDFEQEKWIENNPEGALANVKKMVQVQYNVQKEEVIAAGFEYNGFKIGYSLNEQQLLSSSIMMFFMRPTMTKANILTLNNGYQSFTKDQIFEIYDIGENLKMEVEEQYSNLVAYVDTIEDIPTLRQILPFKEAVQAYL